MSKIRKKIEDLHFDKKSESIFVKILKPVSFVYKGVTKLKRGIYSKRLLSRSIAGCYTVSVGNLTYGGTGKTPVVISLAAIFANRGLRVGIVHSGYGSPQHRSKKVRRVVSENEGAEAGDEAAELFVRAKDALVYSSRDRVQAIERAILEGGVNICILDDAFQYLKVASDLKILVVDYYDLFGNEYCLPAGPMRESKDALVDADIMWFVSQKEYTIDKDMENKFLGINKSLKFIYSRLRAESLIRVNDMQCIDISDAAKKAISFSGIGRDNRFTEMLMQLGIHPLKHLSFGDHHRYKEGDIKKINMAADGHNAQIVITTEKDYLRDPSALNKIKNLHILRVSLDILDGKSELEKLCDSLI